MTLTPEEATDLKCPIARTFSEGKTAYCMGPDCILWRWREKLFAGPEYEAAVKKAVQKYIGQPSSRQKAAADVRKDPETFGLNMTAERGYCGLGGRPE